MRRTHWTVARRALSLALLGLGALSLLVLATGWLTLYRGVEAGLAMVVALAGATAALLAAGLLAWGGRNVAIAAGTIALGVGCQVALTAGVFALTIRGGLGALVPAEFDAATYREIAVGSTVSALGLIGVGLALLAPAIGRLVRRIRGSERPVAVWAVLAWEIHVGVSALASIAFLRSYGDVLPFDLQSHLNETLPHRTPWSLGFAILGLVAAAYLVRRREVALWLFLAYAPLRVAHALMILRVEPPPGVPEFLWVFAVAHASVIEVAILAYVVWLHRRGALR